MDTQERLLALMKELSDRQRYWRIHTYNPYGWQLEFITASSNCAQLLAMTGNRCGKTYTGAFIMATHLTGLYPIWWVGRKYDRPIDAWAAGISTDTTRDILQSELLGDWKDPEAFGTGMIPKEHIVDTVRREGKPGCVQAVVVKHVSGGNSSLIFKSYEMSQDKFMGTAIDIIWLDEECPKDIYTQCVTRTATRNGIVYLTFTPEHGLTEIVKDFLQEIKPGQFLVHASWEDAPHLDEKVKEQLLSVYTPAERKMRAEGMPMLGSGVVFPITEDRVVCEPFAIPDHFKKIIGIDLGIDHPNAIACIAWDSEADKYYLYDERSERGETLSMHADAIYLKGGHSIPVVVPHDAFKRDGAGTGRKFVDLLRDNHNLNVVYEAFSNPPGTDGKHGGNSVEFGVNWMMGAMDRGDFKVFPHCKEFLKEMKMYHRKDGQIIDRNDDVISATRYGLLMAARHAKAGSVNTTAYDKGPAALVPAWFGSVV
ncbi:terminase large subunit [Pseudomonas phage NV1]|uniref:Terminase, large subunit n=1 Tax=Pseudomonas phage NV1 TaxID=2079543 RepID=A0A2L0HPT0_9CAUD|nr:terminase large subunit [Pseudomonas phage NV1]AUX83691.1 putative terminase large subunit [Pseudomonas phage NV1]